MIKIKMNWEQNAARLAAKLCEKLVTRAILPVLSRAQVIVDDSSAQRPLTIREMIPLLFKALSEAGIKFNSIHNSRNEIIIDDEKPEEGERPEARFFVCPHCGFVTPYEEEYWNHVKIHYIGF